MYKKQNYRLNYRNGGMINEKKFTGFVNLNDCDSSPCWMWDK